jgi:septal ring factor EnvC (AmiA/AmiB activator)
MELGELLAVVNLAGLVIVAFAAWTGIKAARQQILEHVNRDLAEVRRQIRTSMKSLDRVQDHVADNREDILKIEVNIARMQDELESMSRKLDAFLDRQKRLEGNNSEDVGDAELVNPEDRRHLFD